MGGPPKSLEGVERGTVPDPPIPDRSSLNSFGLWKLVNCWMGSGADHQLKTNNINLFTSRSSFPLIWASVFSSLSRSFSINSIFGCLCSLKIIHMIMIQIINEYKGAICWIIIEKLVWLCYPYWFPPFMSSWPLFVTLCCSYWGIQSVESEMGKNIHHGWE